MPVAKHIDRLSALIVQDSVFRSHGWSNRLAGMELESGFVLLRFREGLKDLLQCSVHFDLSIAIVEKSIFEEVSPGGDGIPQRMRRSLRPIARIQGVEPDDELERLLMLGCYGFVRDHVSRPSLGRILRVVGAGDIAASRRLLSGALHRLLAGATAPKLTSREHEVLWLLGQRLSNKRIAERLFISGETLRWHLRNLYSKTGLTSRAELVEYAVSTRGNDREAAICAVTATGAAKAFAAGSFPS